ncbi:MAG: hypothetical protein CMJ48_11700 [Planctomycetaceae bacterium]|nr:hypothetical protein [Planctomycetaceae bacterium]
MRITGIEIEQFGVWRDLSLTLDDGQLSVFYGPNEAGKSTLMRFIRGVLYGFREGERSRGRRGRRHESSVGMLTIEHEGELYEIRRASHDGSPGLVSVTSTGTERPGEEVLSELLHGTDEKLFESVFAFGLHELQELATLHEDDIAGHIYGSSLGPEGRRLLEISRKADRERVRLGGKSEESGRLQELLERESGLTKAVAEAGGKLVRHRDALAEQASCSENIASLKERQSGLHYQLRGHLFLERAFEPWNRIRENRAALEATPEVRSFPEDGLVRLDELDSELNSAVKCRDALLEEAEQFHDRAESISLDRQIEVHAATMQSFVDQREWVGELDERVRQAQQQHSELTVELERRREALGKEWADQRLAAVDTSPGAHIRLVRSARNYQRAGGRRARFRKRYDRLSDAYQLRLAEVEHAQEQLGEQSVDDAILETQRRLADVEELACLKIRESELKQRRFGIEQYLARMESRLPLPRWVYRMLGAFGVAGVILALVGVYAGLTTSVWGGLGYAFLALTLWIGSWALKTHFESDVRETIDELEDEMFSSDARLRETREAIVRFAGGKQSTDDEEGSESVLIAETVRRLSELEQLADLSRRVDGRRRRLSGMRARFQSMQREVNTVRQSWCELLKQFGLPETIRVDEAFETWQQVVEADALRLQAENVRQHLNTHADDLQSFQRRIEELGRRMDREDGGEKSPLDVLKRWETALRDFFEGRHRRRQLEGTEQSRRNEARVYQASIDEIKLKRSALLVQGGAATAEEFGQRALWADERIALEDAIAEANDELELAARTEPELAIVEEDLATFNNEENCECIRTINLELEDVELDLECGFEQLGRLKQEIATLESDRTSARLRFDREQVRAELRRAAVEWFGLELADQAFERIRESFEKTCQPKTLAGASQHLESLSCGRHRNIWTPLGKRLLYVDDEQQRSLRVEDLSGGAREQLFLAIRMAMVDDFAARGVELPFVLDDVLVNFDQLRTEAAVKTLLELVGRRQQVLFFTCHLHLAHLFESKGVEPIWLPSHNPPMQERRAG